MQRFDGKRVLVTGAASGIGQATVARLLDEGARVVAADRDAEGLAETRRRAEAAGTGDRLSTREVDISNETSVTALMEGALGDLGGGLDVLVNAAGILRGAHTHEMSLDDWNEIIGINLTGTFLVTRAALPALIEAGRGVVINFSSTSASFAPPFPSCWQNRIV